MKNETWLKLAISKTNQDLREFISYDIGTIATDGHRLHLLKEKIRAKESDTIPKLTSNLLGNYLELDDIKLSIDKSSLKWYKILKHFDKLAAVNLSIKNGIVWIDRWARGSNKDIYGNDAMIDLKVEIGSCDNLHLDYSRAFSLSYLSDAIKASKTDSINIRLSHKVTPLYLSYNDKIAIVCDCRIN